MYPEFNDYATANGFDPATLTPSQKAALQTAWRASQTPAPAPAPQPQPAPIPVARFAPDDPRAATQPPQATVTSFDATWAGIQAEAERQDSIRKQTEAVAQNCMGDVERLKQLRAMCDAAVGDKKTTVNDYKIAMLQFDRFAGPHLFAPATPKVNGDVIEAAICVAHKLPGVEKAFSDQTLQAAHTHFRRGLGIKRLMMMGAQANGFRGDDTDYPGVCRAVLGGGSRYDNGFGPMASVGPSTGVQVPGILGNTANKFLAASFMNVEQAWRGIAKIRPVNDFKQTTTYRMSGNNTFLRVAPSGEIRHGALSETNYTNQAKTYGRMLGISREDYVNDDLGAFISVTQDLGRGAADGINNIFWAAWLDDSTFFPTDKSLLNYDDGATDSVLSLVGLDNAESIFAVQTKPDGTPLGATPKILLVPPALKNTAMALMTNSPLVVGTTPASGPGANVFAGRYTVVSSAFLPRTSLPDENGVSQTVTGSSTAWYLLCDPMDIPCIEVVFLYGKDTPTVETAEFEFDRLGLATRAYFDFGVNKQEYRGGLKLKGAA